jgi:outer membrane lipoprotein-sorting protein
VSRVAVVVALVALAVAGCGSSRASSVVSETGKNVAKIHSGVLDLKLLVTPHDGSAPFGFELKGPFSLEPGKPPVARIVYTQIANGKSAIATLVSTGKRVWVISGSGTKELPAAQARGLSFSGGFSGMDIGSWIRNAKVSNDGPGVDRVTGTLDVVAAANGLTGVAALAGRTVPTIQGDDAKRLEAATTASQVELLTSTGDRLLRRLSVSADLGFNVPASLSQALGTKVGTKIDFMLAVKRPNSRVVVQGP